MTGARGEFARGALLASIAAVSWGFWSLFLRPSGMPALATAVVVLIVMGLTLLPLRSRDPQVPRWDRRTGMLLLGLGLTDALNIGTFFAAMSMTTLGVAVLSHYLTPLLVAMAAPLIDRERVPGARLAALVGTVGLALVLEPWRGGGDGRLLGAALGVASAVGYAGNVFIAARLVPRIGPARTVGYHAFVSAALLLPFVPASAWAAATPRGVTLLVIGGITLGGLSGWLFVRGLAVVGPTLASTLAFLEPLTAVIVGWIVWHERLSPLALLGAALVLGSGVAVARARQAQAATPRSESRPSVPCARTTSDP